MNPANCIGCKKFPCQDMNHKAYSIPSIEFDSEKVQMMMISEVAPVNPGDYYYASEEAPLFQQTTLLAFQDAGVPVRSFQDILKKGIYFTTAVKCGKTGYGVSTDTIKECSLLLEKELELFPHLKTIMLMGDVAIKSLNYIAKRQGEPRVIPTGSTCKIRGGVFSYKGIRVYPSYLQAGPSFFIEKSKRRMIAEDIHKAMA